MCVLYVGEYVSGPESGMGGRAIAFSAAHRQRRAATVIVFFAGVPPSSVFKNTNAPFRACWKNKHVPHCDYLFFSNTQIIFAYARETCTPVRRRDGLSECRAEFLGSPRGGSSAKKGVFCRGTPPPQHLCVHVYVGDY